MPGINQLNDVIARMVDKWGFDPSVAHPAGIIVICLAIAIIAVLSDMLLRKVIHIVAGGWVRRSQNKYDDILFEKGVFDKLSRLGPALIVNLLMPIPLAGYPAVIRFISLAVDSYVLIIIATVLVSVGNAVHDILSNHPIMNNRSLIGYFRVFKVSVVIVTSLMILSIILNRDIGSLLAGLTAFAAVLMFIFKDLIMGLVAGIQISSSDILRVGDYIEMPGRFAEGTVTDIRLNLVKVMNANMTLCVIPTYAFVSEPFMNWRGAEKAGSRRIKRSILIDPESIKFITSEFISELNMKPVIRDVIDKDDMIEYDKGITNVGVYCRFMELYLRNKELINRNNTILVHLLQGSENGFPVEMIAYSLLKNGSEHERLQNGIYEFSIAVMKEFGLRVFQRS